MNFTFNLHPFQDAIFCLQSPKKKRHIFKCNLIWKTGNFIQLEFPSNVWGRREKISPHPIHDKSFFDISQNAYGRRVNLEAFSLLQFSTWVTQMCGFLIQERTDQVQDPGKFVRTTYLNHFFIFWSNYLGICVVHEGYLEAFQFTACPPEFQDGGHVVEIL